MRVKFALKGHKTMDKYYLARAAISRKFATTLLLKHQTKHPQSIFLQAENHWIQVQHSIKDKGHHGLIWGVSAAKASKCLFPLCSVLRSGISGTFTLSWNNSNEGHEKRSSFFIKMGMPVMIWPISMNANVQIFTSWDMFTSVFSPHSGLHLVSRTPNAQVEPGLSRLNGWCWLM